MGEDASRIRQEIDETRERIGDTIEAISYRTDVKERARDAIADAAETVRTTISSSVETVRSTAAGLGERVSDLGERLGDLSDRVSESMPSMDDVRDTAGRAASAVRENPVVLIVGSLLIGFVAGMLLPTSRVERRTFKPLAENAKRMARERAQQAMQRGRDALSDAAKSVIGSANRTRTNGTRSMRG